MLAISIAAVSFQRSTLPAVEPNGGGEAVIGALQATIWEDQLHDAFPNATRIGLWSADGFEVSYTERCSDQEEHCEDWATFSHECKTNPRFMMRFCPLACGLCSNTPSPAGVEELAAHAVLYAVVDDFPFVWPLQDWKGGRRTITIDGGKRLELRALSAPSPRAPAPRVLMADSAASADECAAIARLAQIVMQRRETVEGGDQVDGSHTQRTSHTGKMHLPPGKPGNRRTHYSSYVRGGDDADHDSLRAVWLRMASIARMDARSSELLEAHSYDEGEQFHYNTDTEEHYHIDEGGHYHDHIARRAVTVLLYLNDDFTGGETNFALGGMPGRGGAPDFHERVDAAQRVHRNVSLVRKEFASCQTARGVTVAPRAGSVVLYYNLHPNRDEKDMYTWHASCDVHGGRKLAANLWFQLDGAERHRWHQQGARPQRAPDAGDTTHDEL